MPMAMTSAVMQAAVRQEEPWGAPHGGALGALDAAIRDESRPIHAKELYWPVILGVARDLARGVAYLHQLDPPLVHRCARVCITRTRVPG